MKCGYSSWSLSIQNSSENVQGAYLGTIPCLLAGTGVFSGTDWFLVLLCQVVLSTSVLIPGDLFRLLPRCVNCSGPYCGPGLGGTLAFWCRACGEAIRRPGASNSPEENDTRRTFLLKRLLTLMSVHSSRSQMLFSGSKVCVRSVQEAMDGVLSICHWLHGAVAF